MSTTENQGELEAATVALSVLADRTQLTAYFTVEADDKAPFIHSADSSSVLEEEVEDFKSSAALDQLRLEQYSTFYAALRMGPLLALITVAWGMTVPLWVELLKRRVCQVELQYSANVCAHISDDQFKAQGDAVRSRTADYQLYDTLIAGVPSVFFSLLVGAWSDHFGRKLPMVIPLVGSLLAGIYISIIGNYQLGPGFNLVSSFLAAITGGSSILFMAIFSYIGDYSTIENRSINIVVVECLLSITQNLGSYLGGFIEKRHGLVVPFYIACGLYSSAILYIVIFIRDRKKHSRGYAKSAVVGLFSLTNLKDVVKMLKRTRLGDTRLHLWLVISSLAVYIMVSSRDGAVTQLFTQFNPIRWTLQDYTQWTAITGFVNSGLSMVLMLLMRKYFHISDTLIGCLACLSASVSYFIYGIAWDGWLLYVAAFIGVFRVLMYVSARSLMSTLVDPDEIGKSMSLIGFIQAVAPSLGVVIFTNLFARTSHWWPGLCFIMGAASLIPVLAVLAYMFVARRRGIYTDKSVVQ